LQTISAFSNLWFRASRSSVGTIRGASAGSKRRAVRVADHRRNFSAPRIVSLGGGRRDDELVFGALGRGARAPARPRVLRSRPDEPLLHDARDLIDRTNLRFWIEE